MQDRVKHKAEEDEYIGSFAPPKKDSNPELAKFTPRELMRELAVRGYKGELRYEQVIKIG